jgi:hypothetical protein
LVPRKRRKTGKVRARPPKGRVLARLQADEAAGVLQALIARHPELVGEAEQLSRVAVTEVNVEAVAAAVEDTVLALDLDDLNARAGRQRWGYVEPTEAAWALLEEALEPFLDEMRRRIELGFEGAAVETCHGIVLGLYRCRGQTTDKVLGWAEDFPGEAAGEAVGTLTRQSGAKGRRSWRLPAGLMAEVPEWADLIERAVRR